MRLASTKAGKGVFTLPSGVRGGGLEAVSYEDLEFGKLLGASPSVAVARRRCPACRRHHQQLPAPAPRKLVLSQSNVHLEQGHKNHDKCSSTLEVVAVSATDARQSTSSSAAHEQGRGRRGKCTRHGGGRAWWR